MTCTELFSALQKIPSVSGFEQAAGDALQQLLGQRFDEYLPLLPQGLDTVVGENAAGLSEGQSQRVAIARAVLGGAPILLLDECTSALDEKTEQIVLRRLRELGGRMCIAVTHRPAARELCDWALMVKEGQIEITEME